MDDDEREKREECAQRLRIAIDLAQTGIEMQRAGLRRANPDESEEGIDVLLGEWLRTRPGAERGDGWGIPRESLEDRHRD